MVCALTVRKLKPGSFETFAEKFGPPPDEGREGWVRFHMIRDTSDPDRVVTFGFFDGSKEEMERNQAELGYEERRAEIEEYVERVEVNGVFEVVKEMAL